MRVREGRELTIFRSFPVRTPNTEHRTPLYLLNLNLGFYSTLPFTCLLLAFLSRPGMKFEVYLLQPFHADVGVDFRGGDGRMAQHHLDSPKIGAVFQKVSGEGMAQGVGRELVRDTCFFAVTFENFPESLPGQGIAKPV